MVKRKSWSELGKLLAIKVGVVLPFHLTLSGHVIVAFKLPDTGIVWAPAVGSPFAVIDPLGMTVAAVAELSDWQHNNLVLVIFVSSADGGIKFSGDFAKAIAAGASCAMVGSMIAGTDESPGEVILYHGRSFKAYRGMGSLAAMKEGGGERYFQQEKDELKLVPEGIEGMVPFRGPVNNTIFQLIGGLKSSMGYMGAKEVIDLRKKPKFVKITKAGFYESMVHNIDVIKK